MKRFRGAGLWLHAAFLAGAMPGVAAAQEAGEELLEDYGCYTCHAHDQPGIGPALVAIAKRYAGDRGVAAELARRIREGTTGAWGNAMMGPNPDVAQADADELVAYILGLRPRE